MDQIVQTIEPVKQFAKDSIRLVKRCTKPDKKGKKRLIFHDRQIANNFNFTFQNSKRSLLQPPLDSLSWASSVSLSN